MEYGSYTFPKLKITFTLLTAIVSSRSNLFNHHCLNHTLPQNSLLPSPKHPFSSMIMDRSSQSSSDSPTREPKVLSIECLKGSSKGDEWTGDMLQTGDIVEELRLGSTANSQIRYQWPFKGGKSGVQKILQDAFKKKETSIAVRVRRGSEELAELQACIVPNEFTAKKNLVLRSISDPNYVVGFVDRTEAECFELQGTLIIYANLSSFLLFSFPVFFYNIKLF